MTSESDLIQRQPKGLPYKVSNRGLLDSSLPVMRDPLGAPSYGFVRDTRCVAVVALVIMASVCRMCAVPLPMGGAGAGECVGAKTGRREYRRHFANVGK